ncbi:MAG: polysaccharide deacetylase family protein [Bacteroidales bacterium]|nr:polysaccharide deacetylase family protein [Bacteroidales bacterium]
MILIYSPKITPRIRYIFKLIFSGLLKDEPVFTSDVEEFAAANSPKINYSKDPAAGGLFMEAQGLLSEKEIQTRELVFLEDEDPPAFFPVYHESASMKFDAFAASFYLVSRYEEYLPFVRDEYGRFQARESIAWKMDFLDKPVVNIWADRIAAAIMKKWPDWKPGPKEYRFIPTIDINAAWKFKRKGFFRTTAGIANALIKGEFENAIERMKVIGNSRPDPFDTYEEQLDLHKNYELETIYFVLFADYDNNDRNIPINNRHFKTLIKNLADYCRIGIHTSFASLKSYDKLNLEFKRLAAVLNREIDMTRQHFHVLNMPVTYRNFVSRDVENDYSMGYAVIPGFRAGICDPFYFYDLDFELETNMRIWPYAIVDKALEQGYDPEKSFKPIIDRVKEMNGTLITLWNNESLVKEKGHKANLQGYEEIIRMAIP